jgi:hypothetical protein
MRMRSRLLKDLAVTTLGFPEADARERQRGVADSTDRRNALPKAFCQVGRNHRVQHAINVRAETDSLGGHGQRANASAESHLDISGTGFKNIRRRRALRTAA